MIQAAHSGVRNISEGSGAAATSRKSEIKLTNVARASLNDELLPDYESYLRQNGLRGLAQGFPRSHRDARTAAPRPSRESAAGTARQSASNGARRAC